MRNSLLFLACMAVFWAAGAANAQNQFESSWENGCTGSADSCTNDGGLWDSYVCGSREMLEVVRGGTGGAPPAIDGSHIMQLTPNHHDCRGLLENQMFDVTKSNHYIRYYEYLDCDFRHNGLHGHFFQNFNNGSTTFHFRHSAASGFPGPNARVGVGYVATVDNSVGDCRGNGNYGGRVVNSEGGNDFQKGCGRWYRHELWIECPNNDACLNTSFRTSVPVRLHYRYHEVTTPGSGQGTLVGDNDDIIDHSYNGGFDPQGRSLSNIYAPVSQGGLDACHAYHAGDPSFFLGVNGQTGTPFNPGTWGWVDALAYKGSDTDGDYIGAACGAEPSAPGCNGVPNPPPPPNPDPPPPPPPPPPSPGPLSAPDFLP